MEKLTRFLVHEIGDYALEDLLDPAMPGGSPETAVGLNEFQDIFAQGGVAGQQAQLANALQGR